MALFQTAATKARIAEIEDLKKRLAKSVEAKDVLKKEHAIEIASIQHTVQDRDVVIEKITAELAEASDRADQAAIALKNHKDSEKAAKGRSTKTADDSISARKLSSALEALGRYKSTNPVVRAVRTAIDATK
jgi:hypothetical protein